MCWCYFTIREELDLLVNAHRYGKDEQKRLDEQTRSQFKRDIEEFRQKEQYNKMQMKHLAASMAEISLREQNEKREREVLVIFLHILMISTEATAWRRDSHANPESQRVGWDWQSWEVPKTATEKCYIQWHKSNIPKRKSSKTCIPRKLIFFKLKQLENQRQKDLDRHHADSYNNLLLTQDEKRRQVIKLFDFRSNTT